MPVIQLISSSTVEAYLLWKCCSHVLIFVAKCDAQSKAWHILLVLTSVAGNLCNKCPNGYLNKTAVKVILSMRSLVSIEQQSLRRPCDTPSPWGLAPPPTENALSVPAYIDPFWLYLVTNMVKILKLWSMASFPVVLFDFLKGVCATLLF